MRPRWATPVSGSPATWINFTAWRLPWKRAAWTRRSWRRWRPRTISFRKSTRGCGGGHEFDGTRHRDLRAGGGRREAPLSAHAPPGEARHAVRGRIPAHRFSPDESGALQPAAHPCPHPVRILFLDPAFVPGLDLLLAPGPVLRGDPGHVR